ncbi:hypothetical protein ACVFI8_15965 [Agarivorans sp. MS3-6]|uniref:hypothetical protein n=1 Tax=Agarivorans sp. TSD2052 TaxID=2937286 RepID=UPI00200FBEE3|nr:hypothetical protein [Agarivorans sp. TSD2052]UPW17643.1 hypothetical protein M0C34_15545 [Agarivorans sp. TSD2052]
MQVNYNLQAASLESTYAARTRIENTAPRQTLSEYTARRQMSSPGSAVYNGNDVQPNQSATQLRDGDDAKQANRKQIREAMGRSVDQAATHIRLYFQYMDEKSSRGPQLLAKA